ncbi:cAMP phosphodiesterases class-II-domain-containing protein [Cercophora newfieldiana]|uniref:cAMP phosphodiesterases class-II-domain-containing protein n=1 Tax=Cercophora newfieldiana TaxID=92897 RepID=A0AA39Y4E5_9PEZI|nr:cAMP phosphodiesterases class-II-domain-containing protein [Cercophora newfieldiana]
MGGGGNAAGRGEGEDGAVATRPDALHVIVLGSGGGPIESNITSLLVRSVASGWGRGSIVSVDAGVQLSAIKKILKRTQPAGLGETEELSLPHTLQDGPFAGLEVPNKKPLSNANHIFSSLIDTWLITHPHLDHISGFVVNTAGLPGTRPKRLAGLPSTILALKTHIFNNVVWPNLSDEENGAGLITYMRLVEGGSPAMGEGDSKGYLEVNDGLAVKIWSVSHGHCIERHNHRGSGSGPGLYGRHGSMDFTPTFLQQQHRESIQSGIAASGMSTAGGAGRAGSASNPGTPYGESYCVYDSSAYMIRDIATGREILIFGDVEPDTVSLMPRNGPIWEEASLKIAAGKLAAIFIECSFDDSQSVDRLYGHLQPRYVDEEMRALAREVKITRETQRTHFNPANAFDDRRNSGDIKSAATAEKKRKRHGSDVGALLVRRKTSDHQQQQSPAAPPTSNPSHHHILSRLNTEESISPKTARVPPYNDSPTGTASSSMQLDPHPHPHGATSTGSKPSPNVFPATATDSPHLATPTAELSLGGDDIDMSGPATPISHVSPTAAGGSLALSREGTADVMDLHHGNSKVDAERDYPLRGLKVVIIHVKDKLNDGPSVGETIAEQLKAYEAESRTGVEYIVSYPGQSLYL